MDKNQKMLSNNETTIVFLQKIFIYFWVTSLLGHYLEVVWIFIMHITVGATLWRTTIPTITPLAAPYGFGMVAVILLVIPLIKKYKLHPLGVFILNTFITGAIEYVCAAVLVLATGYNHYWNYSNELFNINGYVCLKSAILFGIGSTLFVYYLYPMLEKIVNGFQKRQFNIVFWLLFGSYFIDLSTLAASGRFF